MYGFAKLKICTNVFELNRNKSWAPYSSCPISSSSKIYESRLLVCLGMTKCERRKQVIKKKSKLFSWSVICQHARLWWSLYEPFAVRPMILLKVNLLSVFRNWGIFLFWLPVKYIILRYNSYAVLLNYKICCYIKLSYSGTTRVPLFRPRCANTTEENNSRENSFLEKPFFFLV